MKREEALGALRSKRADERLKAVRALQIVGLPEDAGALTTALRNESHKWVKGAIKLALTSISRESAQHFKISAEDEDAKMIANIKSDAAKESTKALIHEVRPILGRLKYHAENEIGSFAKSQTKVEFDKLTALLNVMEQLGEAASSPEYSEVELAALLENIAQEYEGSTQVKIEVFGPKPLIVLTSEASVAMIVGNALRNAVESSALVSAPDPVVLSWGSFASG